MKEPKYKVGDKFTLPNNYNFKGVYTITKVEFSDIDGFIYWANFPETKIQLHFSRESRIELYTKLHEALK